jgi:hypothetical protein
MTDKEPLYNLAAQLDPRCKFVVGLLRARAGLTVTKTLELLFLEPEKGSTLLLEVAKMVNAMKNEGIAGESKSISAPE